MENQQLNMVKLLLENHAEMDSYNDRDLTLLQPVPRSGYVEMVKLRLGKRPRSTITSQKKWSSSTPNGGWERAYQHGQVALEQARSNQRELQWTNSIASSGRE